MQFYIPCIHDTKGISVSETVANHYPLTLEQVSMLVNVAYVYRKNSRKIAEIQERLKQGILGMTCPEPEKCEIGERAVIVKKLFMEAMENNEPPVYLLLAVQLFENMILETDAEMYAPIILENDMLTKSIKELELSVRAHTCLEKLDIKTIGELTQKTEAELFSMRYTGPKSINEIKSALNALGLSFAERKKK